MNPPQQWDIVIRPKQGWFDIDMAGVWRHRDLLVLLFKRDFVSQYKQTVLGPLWYVLQPVLTTAMFFIIFTKIARIPTDGTPPFLFYFAAIVIWTLFASCVNRTSDTFAANQAIFGKVYFPRLVAPVSVVLSNLLTFCVQLALLVPLVAWFGLRGANVSIGAGALGLPLLMVYVALLGIGTGVFVSSLTVRFRDLAYLVGFGVQLWMYCTPVVYPLSIVPADWRWLFLINPMTAPVEGFRAALLGTQAPSALTWAANAAVGAAICLCGLLLFSRAERTSMDTV